ncbi:sialidase family protein [Devosia algicola]|uniref:Sialidase family protein n=1 Tax=Devosia algicola TaxID=3026418 RepID=A0ABY7YLU0_9HYPH|nr:sialidase family protein [Devosia algicola]WDR02182.1 sialidase family protein [Devosia algicola]
MPRTPLSIALSYDDGVTWPEQRDIQVGDSAPLKDPDSKAERHGRELSYPTVTEGPEGTINVAFTFFRRAIKFVRFPRKWVSSGNSVESSS